MSKVVHFLVSDREGQREVRGCLRLSIFLHQTGKNSWGKEGGGGVMSMVVQFLILDEEPWIRILTVIRCISVLTGFYSKLGIL